mgnify:CR=1 FL=1
MGRSKPLALARIFTLAASVAAPGLVHSIVKLAELVIGKPVLKAHILSP